jgi:hypothetical protein
MHIGTYEHLYTHVTPHIQQLQQLYTHVHGLELYTNKINKLKTTKLSTNIQQLSTKTVNKYVTALPVLPTAWHRVHFFLPSPGVLHPRTSVRAPFLGLALAVARGVCLPVHLFMFVLHYFWLFMKQCFCAPTHI